MDRRDRGTFGTEEGGGLEIALKKNDRVYPNATIIDVPDNERLITNPLEKRYSFPLYIFFLSFFHISRSLLSHLGVQVRFLSEVKASNYKETAISEQEISKY